VKSRKYVAAKNELTAKLNCTAIVLSVKLWIKLSASKQKDADKKSVLIEYCMIVLHVHLSQNRKVQGFESNLQ